MTLGMSARDGRAVQFGFVGILVLLLTTRGVPALLSATAEARRDARALEAEVLVAERLLRAPVRPPSIVDTSAGQSLAFTASSPGNLASQLAATLGELIDSSGVVVSGLRVDVPDSASAGLVRVVATFGGECDVEGCATLMALVEQERPAIRIARLRLVAGDVGASAALPERLQFEVIADALGRVTARP